MDENKADHTDDFLLIDLYLEGWLDEEAMAAVDRLLETDAALQQRVVVLLALRDEADRLKQEAASREAVQSILRRIAPERQPISRLSKLKERAARWVPAALLLMVLGFGLYWLLRVPAKPPIARRPPVRRDTIQLNNEPNDPVAHTRDSLSTSPSRPPSQSAQLVAIRPLTLYVPEKDDDLFGIGTADVPVDTLTLRLYRVTGRAEYAFRGRTLTLYLPDRLQPQTALRLRRLPDSTFTLQLNKALFKLRTGGRFPLR